MEGNKYSAVFILCKYGGCGTVEGAGLQQRVPGWGEAFGVVWSRCEALEERKERASERYWIDSSALRGRRGLTLEGVWAICEKHERRFMSSRDQNQRR